MWIARDEDKSLWLFKEKPIRGENNKWGVLKRNGYVGELIDIDSFQELEWEDEPIEVELVRK